MLPYSTFADKYFPTANCCTPFGISYPHLASQVYRPNIHCLLELVYHTILLFNHVSFVCELVFESSHQPLKFFLSRNHTMNSHIYSVHLILAKDWLIRLWSLWHVYRDETETDNFRHWAFIGLVILFGELKCDEINWKSPSVSSHLEVIRDHVQNLMIGIVETRLDKWYTDGRMAFNSEPFWMLHPPVSYTHLTLPTILHV